MSTEVKRTTGRNVLGLRQRHLIIAALEPMLEVIEPTTDERPGKCRYKNGDNDPSAARRFTEMLGFEISAGNVGGIRRDIFGDILPAAASAKLTRLDAIEVRLAALETKFSELEG